MLQLGRGWPRGLAGCHLVTIQPVPAALLMLTHRPAGAGCGQQAPGLPKHPSDVMCPA